MEFRRKLETICAGAGIAAGSGEASEPLVNPICASSVFRIDGLGPLEAIYSGEKPGFIYTRDANPNHRDLEEAVAAIEGAEAALACATGMAAVAVALLALAGSGDHIVASDSLYGVTGRLIREEWRRLGVTSEFVDAADARAVERALRPGTRLVFVETLSNPLLRLADLPGLARACRARGVPLVVDNTFTPCLVRPLEHGAEVVMHSVTKYLGGHSDLTLGALAGRQEFIDRCRGIASRWGTAANPFEAWLALRGIRTLPLRMERSCENAARIARFLATHPAVEQVFYPGLPEHPQAGLAGTLLQGGTGAMVTFRLRIADCGLRIGEGTTARQEDALAGNPQSQGSAIRNPQLEAAAFIDRLKLIPLSPSLADTTTTLSHPASTSHRGLPPDELAAAGIDDRLIRLSAGIDHVDDILADLSQALER